MMNSLQLHFAVFFVAVISDCGVIGNTLCAFSKKDYVKYKRVDLAIEDESLHQHSIAGHNVDANNTEHCSKDSDSCYVLWQEDPVNKSIMILTQGCWDSSGDVNCGYSECIANKKPPKALNNTKFCCCSGNLCNINVTDGYVSPTVDQNENLHPALQYVEPVPYTSSMVVIIAVVAMAVFVILALAMYYLFRYYFHPPKRSKESLHLIESATTPTPVFDFDSLKIQETIGRGRYGTVCRGTLQEHTVAVKIFTFQNKQYYCNERDIYNLPHMEHPSILKFIGSEERLGQDGRPEFLLVLSFSAIGCLQDYLRNHTVDWSQLCLMSLSIARGLAHLHTEQGKGEKVKPCVAHRDLTSRNILMKADGSCMLCDFGFAIRISGSKYFQNGEEQVAETTSLADVGTLRYMAPENLEGAVNLRDCESSLKQIDVYALGLVLWEIATRCTDLFQGVDVSEYKLPFEAEVGVHPTMEQMQVLVARHKARPLFPDIWKDTNPAVRTLKETIEECWDQDAEARLTTLCVEERLAELPDLWMRYKAGLGTTCVSSSYGNLTSSQKALCKMRSSGDINCETLNNCEVLTPRERAHSLSEGTTETLLSPSEPEMKDVTPVGNLKNSTANNASSSSKVSIPLQPYQGRNPCLERNLMLGPVDEVAISGNSLLERGNKVVDDCNFRSFSDGDTAFSQAPVLDSSSLLSNDLLSHSTQICNPIPRHLNVVHSTTIVPKQPNIPGNGHTLGQCVDSKLKEDRHWRSLNFFDRKKKAREGIRAGIMNLLERKSLGTSNKDLSEEQQPLKGSSGNSYSCTQSYTDKCMQDKNIWASDQIKPSEQLIDTEVRVIKPDLSSTVVRPVNNAQVSSREEERYDPISKVPNGVAKPIQNNAPAESAVSLNNVQKTLKVVEKTKRPNSLPLSEFHNGLNDNSAEMECSDAELHLHEPMGKSVEVPMRRKNSNGKRKGVKRVKTPFEIKGRFSLYDDRIMSSQELSAAYSKETVQPILGENTKFSTSVPLDMNSLCSTQSNITHNAETQSKTEDHNLKNAVAVNVCQLQVVHSLCDI